MTTLVSNEKLPTDATPISLDVYVPPAGANWPGVLILHGTLGLNPPFGPDIVSFAEALNNSGIAAVIPHYFEYTGTAAGDEAMEAMFHRLPDWERVCGSVLSFMAADARFDRTRLGVIGFSLGGHLALKLSMQQRSGMNLKGVVDFFGPTLEPPVTGDWSKLPPILIHHGTLDPLSIENSRHVVRELERVHRQVTKSTFGQTATGPIADDRFIEYPGEKHGFTGAALVASRDWTTEFLKRELS
jgi:dienelactone hydrolase